MLFKQTQWLFRVCILATTITAASGAMAQTNPDEDLTNFMTSDVIGIAYIDIENVDLKESVALMDKLGFRETIRYQELLARLPEAEKDISKLKEAGLSRVYALLRTSDIQEVGTSFVMPLETGSDPQLAIEAFEGVFEKLSGGKQRGYKVSSRDGALIAAADAQFDRLMNEKGSADSKRPEIWKAIGQGSLGVVLFGDEDSRRVVQELMPEFPSPFEAFNGDLVAVDTKWLGMSLKLDATPKLNIEIETSDETSAETYESLLNNAIAMARQMPQISEAIQKSEVDFMVKALTPKRDGTRVSISASQLTNDLDRLATAFSPQIKAVRESARKTQTLNTIRQHLLAMHNYESAHGRFPVQFSVDKDGKPLLSWRVHVLPFLEQNELYRKFNLDEPWDSENNIKLAEQMPEVFWDMNGKSFEANKAGKTIFQVPAGEGLAFNGGTEFGFGDLTDGSSNTIGLVAMPVERAVIWTKPVDWNVDLKKPLEMLKAEGRTHVVVGRCDGSTDSFALKSPETWRSLLGPADGEVIDESKLK